MSYTLTIGDFHNDVHLSVLCIKENGSLQGFWPDFCKEVGLWEVFYDPTFGLIENPGRPGFLALDETHLEAFKRAKENYACKSQDKYFDKNVKHLDWLIGWTSFALLKCKTPTFRNS